MQATGQTREAVHRGARSPTRSASAPTASTCTRAPAGDNYIDISSLPFQIPLGALIPQRVENLLPACKNIGTTHITNGCYRLHPVEWSIGEAAGALVAQANQAGEPPRQIRNDPKRLAAFQQALRGQGVELEWPSLRPL